MYIQELLAVVAGKCARVSNERRRCVTTPRAHTAKRFGIDAHNARTPVDNRTNQNVARECLPLLVNGLQTALPAHLFVSKCRCT